MEIFDIANQVQELARTAAQSGQKTEQQLSELKTDGGELRARLLTLEQSTAEAGRTRVPWRTLGPDPFRNSAVVARLTALQQGHSTTGRIPLEGTTVQAIRALISGTGTDSPSGTFPVQPQRGAIVPPVQRPLTLLDVIESVQIRSNSFEYVRLSRANMAAVQEGEGALKAETEILTELVTAKVATIAHHTTASRQLIEDVAGLSEALRGLLGTDVLDEAERLLIDGNGTTEEIAGLRTLATPVATTSATPVDTISEAIAIMLTEGYRATLVIAHPLDWHAWRVERATDSGVYVNGNWSEPAAPVVWGLPVVASASMPQGEALVIDANRVRILDRAAATVMVSTEHSDNFTKNMVTLLAEIRLGLAVYDTGAVGLVALPANSP